MSAPLTDVPRDPDEVADLVMMEIANAICQNRCEIDIREAREDEAPGSVITFTIAPLDEEGGDDE